MIQRLLPPPLLGALGLVLLTVNTVFWAIPFYLVTFAKILVPVRAWHHACVRALTRLAELWISVNSLGIRALYATDWDIEGLDGLSMDGSYLVNSNHQSWIDIIVLQRVFNRRIPFLRFFVKRELIWVPILGIAWWALELPFMKRYSREFLAKHPELKGEDLETTRKACERLRPGPVSIMNFLEGTRFTSAKHAAQESPYRHLLRPKAGGIAFVLDVIGQRLPVMLDVTIVYPDARPTLWSFVCGRVPRVVVHVRQRPIPPRYCSAGYAEDSEFRAEFQDWVRELWVDKDGLIEDVLNQRHVRHAA